MIWWLIHCIYGHISKLGMSQKFTEKWLHWFTFQLPGFTFDSLWCQPVHQKAWKVYHFYIFFHGWYMRTTNWTPQKRYCNSGEVEWIFEFFMQRWWFFVRWKFVFFSTPTKLYNTGIPVVFFRIALSWGFRECLKDFHKLWDRRLSNLTNFDEDVLYFSMDFLPTTRVVIVFSDGKNIFQSPF